MLTLWHWLQKVVFSPGVGAAVANLVILILNACQKMKMDAPINQSQKWFRISNNMKLKKFLVEKLIQLLY